MNNFSKKPITVALAVAFALLTTRSTAQTTTAPTGIEQKPKSASQAVDKIEIIGTGRGLVKPTLRDDIIKTESFDAAQMERTGASNINEALDKNPGIAVQLECSICNVRNVLLNNLPGRYTTLLIDGIPIYSSVSSAYGLDSVGLNGVERIDVSRGAATSLIAPEALSGVVNVVTKRPTIAETILQGQFGSFNSKRLDLFSGVPLKGGAISVAYNHNDHPGVDADKNGVSEYTGYVRDLLGFAYFIDDAGGFKVQGRIDGVKEKRGGGALGRDYAAIRANLSGTGGFNWTNGVAGSPDRSGWRGPDGTFYPYDAGRGGFAENIFTDRLQGTVAAEKTVGTGKLRLAAAAASHKQDSFYEGEDYQGQQKQYYFEASYQLPLSDSSQLTTGVNYRYEDLKSTSANRPGELGIDNYKYQVPGLFAQYFKSFGVMQINTSVRVDKHNVFGTAVTPRFNLQYDHTDELSSRFAIGNGFRAPTSFYEQDHGILATTRVVKLIDKVEKSENVSYALNYTGDRFAATASANYTRIKNFAKLNPDGCILAATGKLDEGGGCDLEVDQSVTIFSPAKTPVVVQGLDFNSSYKVTPTLTATFGAEATQYKFDAGTLAFARPRQRVYLGMDWDAGNWDITSKATHTGSMNLRKFYEDASDPASFAYNLDGTRKQATSPKFWTVDLRAEYSFGKALKLFVGADNLTNYQQIKKESPLLINDAGAPDVVYIWGPMRGRYIYGGLRYTF